MPVRTKRWNDPADPDDGFRVLVCRYRPRGVRKDDEPWDGWMEDLGPSRALHADYYGKQGPPISWADYRARYLEEMKSQRPLIEQLAGRVRRGETVTLLCSSRCLDEERCHRSLLRGLIERAVAR